MTLKALAAAAMAALLTHGAASGTASAADIKVICAGGIAPVLTALAGEFEKTSGHKLVFTFVSGPVVQREIDKGARFDVAISQPEVIENLIKSGKIAAGSRADIARTGVGVSVRAGAPKPDISTVEAYTKTLLAAKSIGYSYGCSGQHTAEGIAQLGLTEQIKPKLTLTGAGKGPVTSFLARGDFELGIQQTNIMVGAPGTDYVGPVPAALNKPCPNSVALLTVSKEPDAARAMIKFMTSPEAVPLLRKVHELPASS
jgi:molybdate transport system substrate-binding protein